MPNITDPDAAFRRGYEAAKAEPWQKLKAVILTNPVATIVLIFWVVVPSIAYLVDLFTS
jgi:uncharacterized protein with von Willebrand factor type A (vWA) domain